MTPSQLKISLRHLMLNRRPAFIWGPPGVGKSDIVESIAEEDKIGLIDFRMALRDPTDIKGFPMPDIATKTMKFFRDGELPTKGKGILFLDELNSATPATQAAAMQLTLTGKIGDYTLPKGWSILAAGNRESDRSVVNRMPAALALRFTHLDLEVSLDDWCAWAMDKAIPTELIAFLRFRPNLLHAFDPTKRSSPNPRSWSFVSEDLNAGLTKDIELELANGKVGEGAASEYIAFLQVYRDLPSIDEIMLNPDKVPVPTAPATLYALASALGAKVKHDTFDRAMQYITRMPIEFQVVTIRDACRQEPKVASTKAFIKWGILNSSIVM
jgi:hypothetical protein